jgi:hypothetical protein
MLPLKCWWEGHVIKADVVFRDNAWIYVYHCERCKRSLRPE